MRRYIRLLDQDAYDAGISFASFDPRDPDSIAMTERALQARYGVRLPICNDPEPSLMARWASMFGQWRQARKWRLGRPTEGGAAVVCNAAAAPTDGTVPRRGLHHATARFGGGR